ncbi:MAG: hypothetical protein R3E91_00605 [Chlamydiales bacterium]
MPTSYKAKQALFSLLPKTPKNVFELGSGWGNLACSLAKHYPWAWIHAFEGSWFPWIVSLGLKKILGIHNLKISRKNFLKISIKEADLVVCYLYPKAMEKLKSKFKKEMKPGTWIITNTFSIPGWIPIRTVELNDLFGSKIYLYIN